MASVTNVHVNPLNFALANLAQLSFIRSAAVLISISHSSNFVESYSLKAAISCRMGWLGSFAFVYYARCLCTDVLLLQRVQLVWVKVVDEALLRDFVVHIICSPNSLLAVLLQPLLIGISHLSPS